MADTSIFDNVNDDSLNAEDELRQALLERRQRKAMAQTMQSNPNASFGGILSNLGVGIGSMLQGQDPSAPLRANMAAMNANAANQAKLAALGDDSTIKALSQLAEMRNKKQAQNALFAQQEKLQKMRDSHAMAMAPIQAELQLGKALSIADIQNKYQLNLKAMGYDAEAAKQQTAQAFQGQEKEKERTYRTESQQKLFEQQEKLKKLDIAGKAAVAKIPKPSKQGGGTMEDRLAMVAADKIHKDPNILTLTSSKQLTDRAVSILNRPKITNEEFNDAQIEISNAVAGARSSALGKLERTEYDTYAQRWAHLVQKITGNPQDAVPEEILQRAKSLANEMAERFSRDRSTRAEMLRRSYSSPLAQKNQDEAISKYKFEGTTAAPKEKQDKSIGVVGGLDLSKMSREQKIKLLRSK